MGSAITEADLDELLIRGSWTTAFRFAAQPSYKVGVERDALAGFAAGEPRPPAAFAWWQEWVDLVASLTARGRTIERVCGLDDPPTLYQRWLRWGDPWHAAAGERIFYILRSLAARMGLPLDADWWVFDMATVAVMRFTPDGELAGIDLLTDPGAVRPYIEWRRLALRHATAAANMAAA